MSKTKKEIKIIYGILLVFFTLFLALPFVMLLFKSLNFGDSIGITNYINAVTNEELIKSIINSIVVALFTAFISTVLGFILSYSINCSNISKPIKKVIEIGISIPMLLPTITYGFAIIYSFGKQGLLTKFFGRELLQIYGFNGLLIGYVIYTLPSSFLIINNSFKYVDKKFITVSKLMGDKPLRTFINTIIRPLIGTLGGAFILAFVMSFTDFGIPASVGGTYSVVPTYLYQTMLGAIPDFNSGAVIAILMLIPAVFGVLILNYLDKFNFHYDKISNEETCKNKIRDSILGAVSIIIITIVLSIFIVMFIAPFMNNFPYDMRFTTKYFTNIIKSNNLLESYKNSVIVALISAIIGTIIAYLAALINSRSSLTEKSKSKIDWISMVTNTVPGMVLGLSYLMIFNKSSLKGTFAIIIIANIVHFFTTPYLMAKNSLSKMNPGWEITGELMGDSWFKTIRRVVIPNSAATIVEMISYYFINSMVTISAVIFLVGAKTAIITTKIKELQHYAEFNEIFILSILIFITNILVKIIFEIIKNRVSLNKLKKSKNEESFTNKRIKRLVAVIMVVVIAISFWTYGKSGNEVVIYTNADEEAILAMENALNNAGYENKFILQSFGTSELGGRLIAEGKEIEADLVTMSSYYLESANDKNHMFLDLTFDTGLLNKTSSFYLPILAITGALFINTEVIKDNNLEVPTSIKDLTKPEYKGLIAIPSIMDSSTAWLLVQAIINEYGRNDGLVVIRDLINNAGDHVESSGSGPINKVRAGEVAVGFGLRHQAVKDKAEGLPIDYIDPIEGNFSLTEAIAVVDKGDKTNELAMEMAEVIVKNAREEIINNYPVVLYEGEEVSSEYKPSNLKSFKESLTVDLLEDHQNFFKEAMSE